MPEPQANGEDTVESARDSVMAAVQSLKEAEEPAPEPDPDPVEEPDPDVEPEEDPGEETEPDPESGDDPEEEPGEPETEETVLAPASWSKADREAWEKAPDEVKEVVARREAERERKFHDDSRALAPLRSVVGENEEFFRQIGVAPDEGIRALIGTAKALRFGTATQKTDLLRQIAKDYEVPLEGLIPPGRVASEDEDLLDPEFRKLEESMNGRLERIENTLSSRQSADNEARKRTADDTSAAFFNALDTADPKAFPEARYVEEVYPAFSVLVDGELRNGSQLDVNALKDIYSRAAWSVPEVRAKLLQDQAAEAAKTERRVKRTVKKVSSSTSGGTGSAPHSEDLPEKETVRESVLRSIQELTPVP